MTYKGIVLDLDNTLIRGEPYGIFKEDIKALRALKEKGVKIVIATGKTYENAKNIEGYFDFGTPLICNLGALIKFGEWEKVYPLDANVINSMKEWCVKKEKDFVEIYKNGAEFNERLVMDYVSTKKNSFEGDIIQMVICINEDELKEIEQHIKINNLQCWIYAYKNYVVCISNAIDKGEAFRVISRKYNWDSEDFIAIGNYPSDSSLFDEVGKAIVIKSNSRSIPEDLEVFDDENESIALIAKKYFSVDLE